MAKLEEVLDACQVVVNALAVGQGINYHPASMIELSNRIAVALEEVSRVNLHNDESSQVSLDEVLNIIEKKRRQVLSNPYDPTLTEHFVDLQNEIRKVWRYSQQNGRLMK